MRKLYDVSMYLYLFVYYLFIINESNGDVHTDMKYIKACNETSPISLETMNRVLIEKQLEESISSNNFKCFLHCLFTKYDWMDEDGGFLIHNMKGVFDEAELEIASLEYILFKCTAISSIDKCERAFLFTECFWKKTVQKSSTDHLDFYHVDYKK